MNCRRFLTSLSVLLTALPASAQEPLATAALRDWYTGVTVDGHTERGATFRAHHGADGRISAVVDGQYRNSGTWKIQDPGQVCIAWSDTAWGKDPCFAVYKDGEFWKVVRVDDPRRVTKVKRLEGNPFGL